MKNIYILIPSYNPDEKIMNEFLKELKKEFKNILIVNDGSINKMYFESLEKEGYEIINNYVNLGKGRALKNGINYLLNKYPKLEGIVTCDCDGQHTVKDIKKIANKIHEDKNELILGVRKFNNKEIPFKSKFGNNLTKFIFKKFIGLSISDTQTGLRGMNKNIMTRFLDTFGERYEYETKMLIKCKTDDIKIVEVPIETIYINNNSMSHFDPIRDSIIIYKLFTNYLLNAFSSYIVDIILFLLMFSFSKNIILSTLYSRVISSVWHYFVNANLIFKNMSFKALGSYYSLVAIQMFLSALFVLLIYNIVNDYIFVIKIFVDLLLLVASYYFQKKMMIIKE